MQQNEKYLSLDEELFKFMRDHLSDPEEPLQGTASSDGGWTVCVDRAMWKFVQDNKQPSESDSDMLRRIIQLEGGQMVPRKFVN